MALFAWLTGASIKPRHNARVRHCALEDRLIFLWRFSRFFIALLSCYVAA
jgi:hypothetical protein